MRKPTDDTLIKFSRLYDSPPEEIRDFARKYGVLRAYEPRGRKRKRTDIVLADGTFWAVGEPGLPAIALWRTGEEPIALWRYLSRRLAAILRINVALKGRTKNPLPMPGLDEDWQVLDNGPGNPPLEDPEDAQFFLLREINNWLRSGSVSIELGILAWSKRATDWKLVIAYTGLLGALAYQLLLTVVGESNLYACDGCSRPYIRTDRAPRDGQENFCPDCGEVAKRRASQRWKIKNKKIKNRKSKGE